MSSNENLFRKIERKLFSWKLLLGLDKMILCLLAAQAFIFNTPRQAFFD